MNHTPLDPDILPPLTASHESGNDEALLELFGPPLISSPISKLPPEILSVILLLCLPPWDDDDDGKADTEHDTLHPFHAPWVFTLVSNFWRNVAVSEKRLWCTIILRVQDYTRNCGLERLPKRLKEHLQNSGECPLCIRLHGLTERSILRHPATTAQWRAIMNDLNMSSSQWERIHITRFSFSSFWSLNALENRLPLLQSVCIVAAAPGVRVSMSVYPGSTISCGFANCPNLRRFEFYGTTSATVQFFLPWHLVTLGGGISLVMSRSVRAQHLRLRLSHSTPWNLQPILGPRSLLDYVEILELVGSTQALEYAVFPRLHTLSINCMFPRVASIFAMLFFSSCTLTTLELTTPALTDRDLFMIFILTPALTSLVLDHPQSNTTDRLLNWLTANHSLEFHAGMLSKLERLNIWLGDGIIWSDAVFLSMIESRCHFLPSCFASPSRCGTSHLKVIGIKLRHGRPHSIFDKLAVLQGAGLEVTITYI